MTNELDTEEVSIDSITQKDDGYYEGKLKRIFYGHEPEAVWQMLTKPDKIPLWLAPGTIELKKGGQVKIAFEDSGITIDSEVIIFEPHKVLSYSWSSGDEPNRPLRFELTKIDEGTELTLRVGVPKDEDPVKSCAGFEGHLEMLATALEGVPTPFPFELYLKAREAYQKLMESKNK